MMDDDDDYSKTCGPVLDRRSSVNLDELFAPLSAKSKECDNLAAVAEEEAAAGDGDDAAAAEQQPPPPLADAKATSLVNDINTRFSNDCTQTVGPFLDTADASRKVSVRDLFKPLDSKSKEMHNLAEEPTSEDGVEDDDGRGDDDSSSGDDRVAGRAERDTVTPPPQQTQTCGPVMMDGGCDLPAKPNLERMFDRDSDEGYDDREKGQQQQQQQSVQPEDDGRQEEQQPLLQQEQREREHLLQNPDGDDKTSPSSSSPPPPPEDDDGGPQRLPVNPDHGILTTKDGTPLIRLRSKKSIMESRFKLTMRTWDDVWKSTAWAKFAPDKLKQTLHRSSRNHSELKATDGGDAAAETPPPATTSKTKSKAKSKTATPASAAPGEVPVKKSRFKVVPHVQIDDAPAAKPQRSSPKPPLSSSSGSSDTDSDRLPAGLPMIESNLNELTMVESELKKLEREHVAKHQLLTPNSAAGSADKTSLTADDGAVAGDGRKQQHAQQRGVGGDGKDKDKASGPKVASRAAETHSKRLGWLKAFRRKSSADTGSEAAPAVAAAPTVPQPAAKPAAKHRQQAAGAARSSSTAGGRQSSPRQPQKQRASAANRSRQQQQHHGRPASAAVTTVVTTPVSLHNNDGVKTRRAKKERERERENNKTRGKRNSFHREVSFPETFTSNVGRTPCVIFPRTRCRRGRAGNV